MAILQTNRKVDNGCPNKKRDQHTANPWTWQILSLKFVLQKNVNSIGVFVSRPKNMPDVDELSKQRVFSLFHQYHLLVQYLHLIFTTEMALRYLFNII